MNWFNNKKEKENAKNRPVDVYDVKYEVNDVLSMRNCESTNHRLFLVKKVSLNEVIFQELESPNDTFVKNKDIVNANYNRIGSLHDIYKEKEYMVVEYKNKYCRYSLSHTDYQVTLISGDYTIRDNISLYDFFKLRQVEVKELPQVRLMVNDIENFNGAMKMIYSTDNSNVGEIIRIKDGHTLVWINLNGYDYYPQETSLFEYIENPFILFDKTTFCVNKCIDDANKPYVKNIITSVRANVVVYDSYFMNTGYIIKDNVIEMGDILSSDHLSISEKIHCAETVDLVHECNHIRDDLLSINPSVENKYTDLFKDILGLDDDSFDLLQSMVNKIK